MQGAQSSTFHSHILKEAEAVIGKRRDWPHIGLQLAVGGPNSECFKSLLQSSDLVTKVRALALATSLASATPEAAALIRKEGAQEEHMNYPHQSKLVPGFHLIIKHWTSIEDDYEKEI